MFEFPSYRQHSFLEALVASNSYSTGLMFSLFSFSFKFETMDSQSVFCTSCNNETISLAPSRKSFVQEKKTRHSPGCATSLFCEVNLLYVVYSNSLIKVLSVVRLKFSTYSEGRKASSPHFRYLVSFLSCPSLFGLCCTLEYSISRAPFFLTLFIFIVRHWKTSHDCSLFIYDKVLARCTQQKLIMLNRSLWAPSLAVRS